jgi:cell division protein FtsX
MSRSSLAGLSGGAIVLALFIGLVLAWGWVWLVTLAVNFVLAHFGMAPVGMLFVWVCMLLLSVVGSYLKSTKVEG